MLIKSSGVPTRPENYRSSETPDVLRFSTLGKRLGSNRSRCWFVTQRRAAVLRLTGGSQPLWRLNKMLGVRKQAFENGARPNPESAGWLTCAPWVGGTDYTPFTVRLQK